MHQYINTKSLVAVFCFGLIGVTQMSFAAGGALASGDIVANSLSVTFGDLTNWAINGTATTTNDYGSDYHTSYGTGPVYPGNSGVPLYAGTYALAFGNSVAGVQEQCDYTWILTNTTSYAEVAVLNYDVAINSQSLVSDPALQGSFSLNSFYIFDSNSNNTTRLGYVDTNSVTPGESLEAGYFSGRLVYGLQPYQTLTLDFSETSISYALSTAQVVPEPSGAAACSVLGLGLVLNRSCRRTKRRGFQRKG